MQDRGRSGIIYLTHVIVLCLWKHLASLQSGRLHCADNIANLISQFKIDKLARQKRVTGINGQENSTEKRNYRGALVQ
jgi:hypothetical protein